MDQDVFQRFYTQIYENIYYFAVYVLGTREEAKKIVSDTIKESYIHFDDFKDVTQFRSWVFRLLSRRLKKQIKGSLLEGLSEEHMDLFDPSSEIWQVEESQDIRKVFFTLEGYERILLAMTVFLHYNEKEISRLLSIREGKVRDIKAKALNKMQVFPMKQSGMLTKIQRSASGIPIPKELEPDSMVAVICECGGVMMKTYHVGKRGIFWIGMFGVCGVLLFLMWPFFQGKEKGEAEDSRLLAEVEQDVVGQVAKRDEYRVENYTEVLAFLQQEEKTQSLMLQEEGKQAVKVSGEYLYVLTEDRFEVQVIKTTQAQLELVTTIGAQQEYEYPILDFYIYNQNVILIWQEEGQVRVSAYDTTGQVDQVMTLTQSGRYHSYYQVGEYVYVFTFQDGGNGIPRINDALIDASDILIPGMAKAPGFLTVSAMKFPSFGTVIGQTAILAEPSFTMVDGPNIYLGYPEGGEIKMVSILAENGAIELKNERSIRSSFDLFLSLKKVGDSLVLLTTDTLSILSMGLEEVIRVEDYAAGKLVTGATWIGEALYLFLNDSSTPEMGIDFTQVKSPILVDELGIDGFEGYWREFKEARFLSIEPDSKGIKMVMYDSAEIDQITQIHAVQEEGYVTLPGWTDQSAVFISEEKGMIGFGVWKSEEKKNGDYLLYTYNETTGFQKVLKMALSSGSPQFVRGILLGDWFYVIQPEGIQPFHIESQTPGPFLELGKK